METILVGLMAVMGAQANWHADAFFGLHYDLHANAGDTELGRETTYDHIREQLEKVGPDFVQYDCKGHPGWAGYPTKVGSPSPGIVNDALAVWRQVTRDMGIPLSIHFSGVWDTRAVELHPEWAREDPDGTKDKNYTCRMSGYDSELMIPQLVEVVTKYDLDGVWIDGENWASRPCWCERCKTEFTRRTGIEQIPTASGDAHWAQWLAFQRDLFTEHVDAYAKALHKAQPGIAVCSNWMYSVRQPEPVTVPVDYLSGDFDPSFGAERASAEARFLSARGLPWDLMAWGFLRTGGAGWTFKTPVHLAQELSVVMAQGGAVFIYDQPQRSGRLTSWHQDVYSEVAEFCRQREAYSHKTETIPQVAVLHSESVYYRHNDPLFNFGKANQAMEGALHALLENGYSVDILNEEMFLERMEQYPVVVVAEQEGLPQNIHEALKAYANGGGRLLISGAHVAAEHGALAGVAPDEGTLSPCYVPAGNGVVIVDGPWQKVTVNDAEALAPLLNQQEPDANQTGYPAATRRRVGKGVVVAAYGGVFHAYHSDHYPRIRRFIGDLVDALDAPLIRVEGPSWIEMAARKKDSRYLIQLVNRGNAGYTAPNRHMVEQVADTGSFSIEVPMAERPRRCYTAPDKVSVDWTYADGVLKATIGGLHIHNVLVIE